ncbi:hypothetical protein [Mucilaginibacter sp. BT774]|uniref:hypothetical protein n=1 Tax=Mucilaginibacter sp. BT774 TaxID=3062276 RepID=UPI002675474B|nr:hypothetical protein [Mucilaginibacter sp. BT774]MDO3625902.1 hypothetical protein [Mucilaginibacter sp. BT774]
MRLNPALFILPVLLFTACKKDSKPSVIEVSVHLQNAGVQSNVNVKLFTVSSGSIISSTIGTSDVSGKIDYIVIPGRTYYLYYDGTNQEAIFNADATYLVKGKFTSQQQINSSPYQGPNTKVGDDIYMDINGDGAITDYDKVLPVTEPSSGGTTSVDLILFTN